MSIGAANEPVQDQSIQEPGYCNIGLLSRQCPTKEARDCRGGRTTLILILSLGRHSQRLARVLLMDTPNPSLNRVDSVVPLGNDRALIFKRRNPSIRRYEARAARSGQTQVFVEIVIIEAHDGWFKDVAGRCRAA